MSFTTFASYAESRIQQTCNYFKRLDLGQLRPSSEHKTPTLHGNLSIDHLMFKPEKDSDLSEALIISSCSHYFCGSFIVYFPSTSSQKEKFNNCFTKKEKCTFSTTKQESLEDFVQKIPQRWDNANLISGLDGDRSTLRYTQVTPAKYKNSQFFILENTHPYGEGRTVLKFRDKKLIKVCQFPPKKRQ